MCGVESNLLDLGEVVLCILIQDKLADLAQGELVVWPNVGEVEDVDLLVLPQIFGFFCGHGLDFEGPFGELAALDGFVKILLGIIGRFLERLLLGEELSALLGDHVKLAVHPFALFVGDLECVAIITVHEAVAIYQEISKCPR